MKVQFREDSNLIFETESSFQYAKNDIINIKGEPYIVKLTNKLIEDNSEMLVVFVTNANLLLETPEIQGASEYLF